MDDNRIHFKEPLSELAYQTIINGGDKIILSISNIYLNDSSEILLSFCYCFSIFCLTLLLCNQQ
jgi:hypothetical protein